MNNCIICGKKLKTESFCELCEAIISTCYYEYTLKQQMALFSHVLGAKVIQEITDSTFDALKADYEKEAIH